MLEKKILKLESMKVLIIDEVIKYYLFIYFTSTLLRMCNSLVEKFVNLPNHQMSLPRMYATLMVYLKSNKSTNLAIVCVYSIHLLLYLVIS